MVQERLLPRAPVIEDLVINLLAKDLQPPRQPGTSFQGRLENDSREDEAYTLTDRMVPSR